MSPAGDIKNGVIQSPGPFMYEPAWVREAWRDYHGDWSCVRNGSLTVLYQRADAKLCIQLGAPEEAIGKFLCIREDELCFVSGWISDEAPSLTP